MIAKKGLVLTGGGARGAYQAGALSGVLKICHEHKIKFPFQYIHGISAGSINCAFLSSQLHHKNLQEIANNFRELWSNLKTSDVINTSRLSLTLNGFKWARSLSLGGIRDTKESLFLLDNRPLKVFLQKHIQMSGIKKSIDEGHLKSISMSMTSYSEGLSRTFFQGCESIDGWNRVKREGVRIDQLSHAHIMASSAIPLLFPPVKIGDSWYGDGSLRDYTPLSPAIKMGAQKLLVIGVRKREQHLNSKKTPSPAKILGTILNGILLDGLDTDIERLTRINSTIAELEKVNAHKNVPLKQVETLVIAPSSILSEHATNKFSLLPKTIQFFINGIGGKGDSSDLVSYILFEGAYTRELFNLGLADAKEQEEKILEFLKS
ncbi:MAG: patatin-like phospholipase family protein [Bacteriovoracaceae bacterium]|nr:patatin-like phospholipase family protein [Bacteriovoracaceae bacterium]